jgi:hypothetical protein
MGSHAQSQGGLASMTEGPWTIVGAVSAIVAAGFGIYEFLIRPVCLRHKLKRPCNAWFLIPSTDQKIIDFAEQTTEQHYVRDLTLPADSEVEIEILYRPSIAFLCSAMYFGCNEQNNKDLDIKPLIKAFLNPLIERGGIRKETPDDNPETNSIDRHKYYHIKKQRHLTRGEIYSFGIKIQTRIVGLYRFRICFIGDEVGCLKNEMFIRVEERVSTRMRCFFHARWSGCFVQPTAKRD